jgi:hypothetical protein
MKQHFTDERTGISYTLQGDYYLPDLALPAEEQVEVGIWGQRHLRYIREHRKALYTGLLLDGKLNSYLADLNEQAEDMFFRLVNELAEKEGITETLKAENQMLWVQRMNAVRETAMEIVNNDLIYA